jgi:adenylate cyclase
VSAEEPRGRRQEEGRGLGHGAALLVLALLLTMQGLGSFDLFDARRHDALLELGSLPPVTEPVIILRIDDATLAANPAPMVLWNGLLAEGVAAAAEAEASVVAIDLLFFSLIGEFLPSQGFPLVSALGAARGSGTAIVSQALQAADEADEGGTIQKPHALIQAGSSAVGLSNLTTDPDGIVRRQELGCADPVSFPLAIARASGRVPIEELPHCTTVPIRFRDTGGRWPGVSLQEVVERRRAGDQAWLREQLEGRIVLLGSTTPALDDHFVTPLVPIERRMTPGLEIHAHTLHTLLSGDAPKTVPTWAALLLLTALALLSWLAGSRLAPRNALIAIGALGVGWAVLGLLAWVLLGLIAPLAGPLLGAFAPGLVAALGRFQAERRARRQLAATLGSYVNEHVLAALERDPEAGGIHGASRRVTVLMADIVGYSAFAERHTPTEVVGLLNEYFSEMTEAIQDAGGTVDKFIGDGLLAIFGAPLPLPSNGAAQAVDAAVEMRRRLRGLHERWRKQGLPALEIGVGIHTGLAVVGNMGSRRKMEYTVIGDAVNVAARIESATRRYDEMLLVSEATMALLPDRRQARDLGEVEVKGRSEPVRLWALADD